MPRTIAACLVCVAIAALAAACPPGKTSVGTTEARCIDFCALDTDERCEGRRAGEYDACVAKCKNPTQYMCRATQDAFEACQSTLSCEEFRDYDARQRACPAESKAHAECTRRLEGPK